MTSRPRLLLCACTMPLLVLAGCASSGSQAASQAPVTAPVALAAPTTVDTGSVVPGDGPDSDHTKVDASNGQIYQAEHAMDPDAAAVSNAQNQGIP